MLEWWHALLIALASSLAAGFLAIVASYVQSIGAREAAEVSDKRQHSARQEAEALAIRRERRRARIQPVLDFLDAAKRFGGEAMVLDVKERILKSAKDDPKSANFVEAEAKRIVETSEQASLDLLRTLMPAVMASPSQKMEKTIVNCHELIHGKYDEWESGLRDAIVKIEDEVDDWIIGDTQ